MKKVFFTFCIKLVLLFFVSLINLQSEIIWEKEFPYKQDTFYYPNSMNIMELKNRTILWTLNKYDVYKNHNSPFIIKSETDGSPIWSFEKNYNNKVELLNASELDNGDIELNCLWVRVFVPMEPDYDVRPMKIILDKNGVFKKDFLDSVSKSVSNMEKGHFIFDQTSKKIKNYIIEKNGPNKNFFLVKQYDDECKYEKIDTFKIFNTTVGRINQCSKLDFDGNLILVFDNFNNQIIKINQENKVVWTFDLPKNDKGTFYIKELNQNISDSTYSIWGYFNYYNNDDKQENKRGIVKIVISKKGELISVSDKYIESNSTIRNIKILQNENVLIGTELNQKNSNNSTLINYVMDKNLKILYKTQIGNDSSEIYGFANYLSSDNFYYLLGLSNSNLYLAKYKPTLLAIEDNKEKFSNEASIYSTSSLVKLNMQVESLDGSADVRIYDAFGKEVKSNKYHIFMSKNSLEFEWDASSQANGIYVISISQGKDSKSFRVLLDK